MYEWVLDMLVSKCYIAQSNIKDITISNIYKVKYILKYVL